MDSQLNNLIGDLVTHANAIDGLTPTGIVGGQCPSPYGGYNYAKLKRKVQFLEAYDFGCSAEIARSLNPGNVIPVVKTGFGDPLDPHSIWFYWYYLAHGDRGLISWADGWFREDGVPEERVLRLGGEIQKLSRSSEKIFAAKWLHDAVAIYYSHPSIQVSWFIDCQTHGKTWINRSSSMNNVLASTVGTFWSWVKMLEDSGIQYNFYSYADLLEKGLDPQEYKVLILPRTLALSDEEAEEMMEQMQQAQAGQQGQVPMISANFQLREGLTVTVSIIVDERTDVLLVPNGAISTQGGQTYVQVMSADGTIEERAVTTGISDWQYTEVTEGLSEGEQVIVPQGTTATTTTNQKQPPGGIMIPGVGGPPR